MNLEGESTMDTLLGMGASRNVAQEIGARMDALSAIAVAQWGYPLEWQVIVDCGAVSAYVKDNLTEINLECG